jgi:cell wall-associated NlpC family hydrolase
LYIIHRSWVVSLIKKIFQKQKSKINSMKAVHVISIIALSLVAVACNSAARFNSGGSHAGNSRVSSSSKYTSKSKSTKKIPKFSQLNFSNTATPLQQAVLNEANKWLGTPYCYGGENLKCTDCSGFVQTVYSRIGMQLPRTAAQQFNSGDQVAMAQAQPGDLVFFKKGSRINHVGIYAGENMFIHASSSRGVVLQSLGDKYYQKRLAGFKRYITI